MDNAAQQSGHGEETKPSTASVYSRPEQIPLRVPTVVNYPASTGNTLLENRLRQAVTVDQQHELMRYMRRLSGWMESEVEERHGDLRRLRASFEQLGRDFRDLQDEESTSTSDDSVEMSAAAPRSVPRMYTGLPGPTVKRPVIPQAIPNQRQPRPVDPQPQPVIVMIPTLYAPRPIPAASRRVRPRQLLAPPQQQPTNKDSPEPPPFIPLHSSESGPHSYPPSAPEPRLGMDPNVFVIPESSSSSLRHGDQSGRTHRRSVDQPSSIHPRQSMGPDVFVVPLSSASTGVSSPPKGMGRLAPRDAASLRGGGILRRTSSGISQRSMAVTNPPSPVPPGPELSTSRLPPMLRPASQPIAAMRPSAQPQHVIQRPLSTAVMPTPGPVQNHQAHFPVSRPPPGPMTDTRFAPIPGPSARPLSSVLMPRAAKGPKVTAQPPVIIRQHSPVSRHRRVQTPIQDAQIAIMEASPTGLSKHHRPQPATVNPQRVILPSQPIGRVPPPPQPEDIIMPARTGSMRNRQNRRQIRSIDRPTFLPIPAVTAMTYPATDHPWIVPQRSPVSSRASLQAREQPVVIRRSSRRRPQPTTAVRQTSLSRLTRRRRPQPSQRTGSVHPPRQPDIVVMPARTESTRNRQSRRQIRSIDRPTFVPPPAVTAMTYPETDGPLIVPLSSPVSSYDDFRGSLRATEPPVVIRRSSRRGPQPAAPTQVTQPIIKETTRSRLTRRRPQPSPQPEIVVMPARTESTRSHQLRRQLRPIDTSVGIPTRAVTAMTYPDTVSHVRTTAQPSTTLIIPQRSPVSSSSNFQSPMHTPEYSSVVRTSAPRSSVHRAPQPATALPIPVVPASQPVGNIIMPSGPGIVLMPARSQSRRSRRNQIRSTDTSPVVLSAPQHSKNLGSPVITESRSHSSLPQSGAVVVPLDSEAEEAMGFRPPFSRRPSFSGNDWISYETRARSTGSDSPQSPPIPVTPFRGRSRSPYIPMSVTPTSRQSQSPPRFYPPSTDLWDKKSSTRSKRGWYRPTESSPGSISANLLLQPPSGRGSNVSVVPVPLSSRGSDRGTGIMLGPDSTAQSSWSKWMDNL